MCERLMWTRMCIPVSCMCTNMGLGVCTREYLSPITQPEPNVHASHWLIVFMTRGTCTCAQACTLRAYPEREREIEPRCTRACGWRICMGHIHGHADGHSGHVLVECVRADCLLVSCSGSSTCAATRSACFRRASLTSSRRLGE